MSEQKKGRNHTVQQYIKEEPKTKEPDLRVMIPCYTVYFDTHIHAHCSCWLQMGSSY